MNRKNGEQFSIGPERELIFQRTDRPANPDNPQTSPVLLKVKQLVSYLDENHIPASISIVIKQDNIAAIFEDLLTIVVSVQNHQKIIANLLSGFPELQQITGKQPDYALLKIVMKSQTGRKIAPSPAAITRLFVNQGWYLGPNNKYLKRR